MKKYYREPTTRNKLGLAQEEYVSFLGIGKSALAMYETNRRSLPTWALIKQGAIEICLNKPGIKELRQALHHNKKLTNY